MSSSQSICSTGSDSAFIRTKFRSTRLSLSKFSALNQHCQDAVPRSSQQLKEPTSQVLQHDRAAQAAQAHSSQVCKPHRDPECSSRGGHFRSTLQPAPPSSPEVRHFPSQRLGSTGSSHSSSDSRIGVVAVRASAVERQVRHPAEAPAHPHNRCKRPRFGRDGGTRWAVANGRKKRLVACCLAARARTAVTGES